MEKRKKIPGCPKKDICKKDCYQCDFGVEFAKMWKIIFAYKKMLKEQKIENELLRHPEAKTHIYNHAWPKKKPTIYGTQIGMAFIGNEPYIPEEK